MTIYDNMTSSANQPVQQFPEVSHENPKISEIRCVTVTHSSSFKP